MTDFLEITFCALVTIRSQILYPGAALSRSYFIPVAADVKASDLVRKRSMLVKRGRCLVQTGRSLVQTGR